MFFRIPLTGVVAHRETHSCTQHCNTVQWNVTIILRKHVSGVPLKDLEECMKYKADKESEDSGINYKGKSGKLKF